VNLLTDIPLASVMDVVRGGIMVLFIVVSVLVILVVLAQEGKGGGLAGAFGGAGADAFGVKAGTVNKFTTWLAASFLGLALLYAGLTGATANPIDTTKKIDKEVEQFGQPEQPTVGDPDAPKDEDSEDKAPEDKDSEDKDSEDKAPEDAPKDDESEGDSGTDGK